MTPEPPMPDTRQTASTGLVPIWLARADAGSDTIVLEFDALRSSGALEMIVRPHSRPMADHDPDGWFDILGWCVEAARSLDMRIWIYDSLVPCNSDASPVQYDPALMGKCLAVQAIPRARIDTMFFEPGQFLIAGRVQGGRITRTKVLTELQGLRALDGAWHVFNCAIIRDSTRIDTLSRIVVARLRRQVYDEYRRRFGSEFGKTIRGVFADDPGICGTRAESGWAIPYTERLFQSFEEAYGYSAVPYIPYLFLPGYSAAGFRADFWEHVTDLHGESFHGSLANWCRENGLLYAGRASDAHLPQGGTRIEAGLFGILPHMDFPMASHPRGAGHYPSFVAPKIASSCAHAGGKPGAAIELSDAGTTETDPLELRKTVDRQFAQGISLLVMPAPDRDSRQWRGFEELTAYASRLSGMLAGGRHLCRILIVYPVSGLFAAYQPDRKSLEFECVDSFASSVCLELARRQLDYDIVDLRTLATATVRDGHIVLADEIYDVLIVPYTPYMRTHEYETIGRIAKDVETYFFYRSVDSNSANVPSNSGRVSFVPTEDLAGFVVRLRHAIDDGIHLTGRGREDILLLQREMDGQRIAFLVNRGDHERKITARFTGHVQLTRMELESGRVEVVPSRLVGKKTEAVLSIPPNGSLALVVEGIGSQEISAQTPKRLAEDV